MDEQNPKKRIRLKVLLSGLPNQRGQVLLTQAMSPLTQEIRVLMRIFPRLFHTPTAMQKPIPTSKTAMLIYSHLWMDHLLLPILWMGHRWHGKLRNCDTAGKYGLLLSVKSGLLAVSESTAGLLRTMQVVSIKQFCPFRRVFAV